MMVLSSLSAPMVQRWGNKVVVGFGMVVLATGLAAIALVSATTSMWGITAITLLMGTGIGSVMAPATDSIMGSVPKEKAGVGSAMNDTTRQAGGAIGVAVLGSILSSKFRTTMSARGRAHHLPGAVIAATRSDVATARRVAQIPLGARYATIIDSTARYSFIVSASTSLPPHRRRRGAPRGESGSSSGCPPERTTRRR